MPGDVVRDLAAAGGVFHGDGVVHVEVRCQRGQVVGVVIQVVAVADLCGTAMPRRSCAMTRKPYWRKNSIWVSQPSAESGQP